MVIMETSHGTIEIELFADKAPITVENFLTYVDEGHFDDTIFHRVIKDFMIQGGGFAADMSQKNTHAPIENEARADTPNLRGTLAMARTNVINSASAQFIINLKMPDPTLFYNQINREIKKGNIRPINPKQLMINIFALSVFPNVASPLMKDFINAGNDEFEEIKKKGKTLVADFVINAIRIP